VDPSSALVASSGRHHLLFFLMCAVAATGPLHRASLVVVVFVGFTSFTGVDEDMMSWVFVGGVVHCHLISVRYWRVKTQSFVNRVPFDVEGGVGYTCLGRISGTGELGCGQH
jgi:hypothetical protein